MNKAETLKLAEQVLAAWNEHDVEKVVVCYTPDCVYRDPNTRGAVAGREAFRKYLSRLFDQWRMHWSLREYFPFEDGEGGAFLWRARLTPVSGGAGVEIDGMDLVRLRGDKLCRNEVYFDRAALFGAQGQ
jgi:ketosteroid isomerase-like protein